MKKVFSSFMCICLLSVVAFAGFADSVGIACNPETSAPGTCFYTPDHQRPATDDLKPDSDWLSFLGNLFSPNPFVPRF